SKNHKTALLRSRSNLPFLLEKAKFYRELEAAVDVVERACRLCVDVRFFFFSFSHQFTSYFLLFLTHQVKKSLLSDKGRILEKNDQTPVTIADFGVQALISLVADKATGADDPLTSDVVLEAIDRGGRDAVSFDAQPATYWVWDHAVGVICIQEAGGKVCFCVLVLLCSIDEKLIVSYQVTDWIGTELDLAADEAGRRIIHPSGGVLVTNGRLHNQLLEMISSNFRVIRHA
ncbi:hypothetical protein BHM03_00051645, partial [Ensete ventricosum]